MICKLLFLTYRTNTVDLFPLTFRSQQQLLRRRQLRQRLDLGQQRVRQHAQVFKRQLT